MKTNLMNKTYHRGFILGFSVNEENLDMLSKKHLSEEDYESSEDCVEYMLEHLSNLLGENGAFICDDEYVEHILGVGINEAEINEFNTSLNSAKEHLLSVFNEDFPIEIKVLEID